LALRTAALYAQTRKYSYFVVMDADGQHDPRFLEHIVRSLIDSKSDVVIGSRFKSGASAQILWSRRIGMWIFRTIGELIGGKYIADTTSGFKAINSTLFSLLHAQHFKDFHSEFLVYLALRGYRVSEVPVVMRLRKSGSSMYGLSSLFSYPAQTVFCILLGILEASIVPGSHGERKT